MAVFFDASDDRRARNAIFHRSKSVSDRQERRYREAKDGRRPTSRFEEATQRMYDKARNSRVYVESLMASRRVRERGAVDLVKEIEDLLDFQLASPRMEDVIMANPVYRRRFHERRLEGYAGGWRESCTHRNAIKHSDPVYQVINNEVSIREDDGSVWAYQYSISDEVKSSMTTAERASARQVWARANEILWDNMADPTSRSNALL